MKIHLLDMGQVKYGDCILITHNNRSILIDGGHPGDTDNIRFQLSKILNRQPPFKIDLLIVTHCHSDHIGCLPELVSLGDIDVQLAILADEKIGFGLPADDAMADRIAGMDSNRRGLFVGLQEEDHSDMEDDEIEQFLFDAARLVDKYKQMITDLGDIEIIRYGVTEWSAWQERIQNQFADFGLRFLGPTTEHLLICADAIARSSNDDVINPAITADASADQVQLYKNIVNRLASDADNPAADMPGVGAAKNNQSIVISVEDNNWKALLAADMQLAKAEVPGLNSFMTDLVTVINNNGPYDFIKLTHHTSYNGLNETLLDAWMQNTNLFGHTGGKRDPRHPDPDTLELLKSKARNTDLEFARTDRNGLITVERVNGGVQMNISKGRKNDFTPNVTGDQEAVAAVPIPPLNIPVVPFQPQPPQQPVAPLPNVVEVITRVPHTSTKVTVTIEVDPEKKNLIQQGDSVKIGGADRLSDLLFITSSAKLGTNIGQQQSAGIITSLKTIPRSSVLDVPLAGRAEDIAPAVTRALQTQKYKGVVIIGGYDVVPSQQLHAIDDALRREVENEGMDGQDADDFIIWTDDIYGDDDGDMLPELPVSRIPDAQNAQLLAAALNAPAYRNGAKFGVRNLNRKFADSTFGVITGNPVALNISEKYSPTENLPAAAMNAVYYMLHGSDTNGTKYWGERPNGTSYEAVNINNLPHAVPGSIVFTGCCWGALTVEQPAYRWTPLRAAQPKKSNEVIALAYLEKGALAFVGCTGSHYSPVKPPLENFGKPMHDHFWRAIGEGKGPAEALWTAKQLYISEIPHGQNRAFSRAAELKILRQYTCLGLGW